MVLVFQKEKKKYSLYINKHSFPGIVNTTHLQSQYLGHKAEGQITVSLR